MVSRRLAVLLLFPFIFLIAALPGLAQPKNLLQNPNADDGGKGWRFFFVDASVELGADGDPHFALRNGMQITQMVRVPEGFSGKYALLVARASSDMINNDGTRTGLPLMHATTFSSIEPDHMVATSFPIDHLWSPPATIRPFEWTTLTGGFRINAGTVGIGFTIARWDEVDRRSKYGPAVRFDDLGLYIFDTPAAAESFATKLSELHKKRNEQ